MKILGINISHHMSYCVVENGEVKSFLNEERLNKQKHFGPTLETFNKIEGLNLFKNIEFDVVALTSWIEHKDELKLAKLILDKLKYKKFIFDRENHHKYHAVSALYHSNLNEAVALIRDGGGAPYSHEYPNHREVDSIWKLNKSKIDFIYGHYSDARFNSLNKEIKKDNTLLTSKVVGGLKYSNYASQAGFPVEYGQFMGLAPYAEVDKKYDNIDYKAVELSHKAQTETFDETCELVEKTNSKNIILSGGYALNCVNNYKYTQYFKNINFFIDPCAHDGGTALGGAVWYDHYR